jgi:hypothetical protein
VLKYLRIPLDRLKEYSDMVEKLSAFNKDTDLDQTLGFKVGEDKNAIFFSVSIYKHLWVDDHYEFYIKVVTRQTQLPYYPIKRFSVRCPSRRNSRTSTISSASGSRVWTRTYSSPFCQRSTSSTGTRTKKSTNAGPNSNVTFASSPTTILSLAFPRSWNYCSSSWG